MNETAVIQSRTILMGLNQVKSMQNGNAIRHFFLIPLW